MQRRKGSGIYEYRKRLPEGVAGMAVPGGLPPEFSTLVNPKTGCFKRELTVSLRTTDPRLAKRRDLQQAAATNELLEALRLFLANPNDRPPALPSPSLPSADEIEAHFLRGLLRDDDEDREHGDLRRHLQTPEERAQWPDLEDPGFGELGMASGHLEAKDDEIATYSKDFREALAKRQIDIVRPELHAYLKQHRIPIDPSSLFYRQSAIAILSAYVRGYDMLKARQAGDIVPTPEAPAELGEQLGPKLSEAFAAWQSGSQARGGRQPSPRTVTEAERAVRYFVQWHGDLRLGEIDKAAVRDFRAALSKLPTRLTGKQKSKGLRKLIESLPPTHTPAHAATVNKSLNLLAAIVSAAERDGTMDKLPGFVNPFRNMRIVLDTRHETGQRAPFSDGQLKTLFTDQIFTAGHRPRGGGGEAAFWFPLIGLLSGARLNEIAQLRPEDLRQDPETSIWFFDIGTGGGRSIKTAGSRRQVPVHAELIRLGLLRYREAVLAGGLTGSDITLWPEVSSTIPKYKGAAFTKWFGRYLRKNLGIEDPNIVFHSFRHTFKRLARDAGLSEELHDALTGHVGGGVGRSYGGGFGLRALSAGMERMAAPDSVKAIGAWSAARQRRGNHDG